MKNQLKKALQLFVDLVALSDLDADTKSEIVESCTEILDKIKN